MYGMANLSTLHPQFVKADIYRGTIGLPMTTVPVENPLREIPRFGLTPVNFEKQKVIRPKPLIQAPPIQNPDKKDVMDMRLLSGKQSLSWLSTFTNGMHRTEFEGWRIVRSKPKNFPQAYVDQLVAEGMTRKEAELYQYVGEGTFVYVDDEGRDHQIITRMDLEDMTANLRVMQNGVGVTMAVDHDGVIQDSFSTIMSQEGFLKYFGFDKKMPGDQRFIRAAEIIYQDQLGDLSYLWNDDHEVHLLSRRNEDEMTSQLDDHELIDELRAQVRVVGHIMGIPQALVKINLLNVGSGYLMEIIVSQPRVHSMLVGTDAPVEHRSIPVKNNLKAYLQKTAIAQDGQYLSLASLMPKVVGD